MSTSIPLENHGINKPTGFVFSGQTQEVTRNGLPVIVAKMIPVFEEKKSGLNKAFGKAAAVPTPVVSSQNVKVNQSYLLWTAKDLKENLEKIHGKEGFDETRVAINRALETVNRQTDRHCHVGKQNRSPNAPWG